MSSQQQTKKEQQLRQRVRLPWSVYCRCTIFALVVNWTILLTQQQVCGRGVVKSLKEIRNLTEPKADFSLPFFSAWKQYELNAHQKGHYDVYG